MDQNWQQKVIAITGSIGSGKSKACEILKELGAFVLSADDLAREAVEPGTAGLRQIVQTFGKEVLNQDGSLNRKKLADIVFTDQNKREELEAITHPIIRELAQQKFSQASDSYPLLVYEVPLLFETGLHKTGFKKTVLIAASKEKCIERLKSQGMSEEKALERLNSQLPLEEKKKLADIIIENNTSIDRLRSKLENWVRLN